MTTITFDNHAFIERLIKKGLKKEQAEAIAEGLKESRELDLNQLVTKDYLKSEMSEFKVDMLKWLIASHIATTATILGALQLAGRLF